MMARKLLRKHMTGPEQEHEIQQIIDHLKSNLFFHGHPINRDEARRDLNLKVKDAPADLEDVMWALYLQYEIELQMQEPFSVAHELGKAPPDASGQPPSRIEVDLPGAYLESVATTHVYKTKLALNRVMINTPAGPQAAVGQEDILRRWEKTR